MTLHSLSAPAPSFAWSHQHPPPVVGGRQRKIIETMWQRWTADWWGYHEPVNKEETKR